MNKLLYRSLGLLAILFSGCAPSVSSPIVIPADYVARDIQILAVSGDGDRILKQAAFGVTQSHIADYPELVQLVSVANDERTLRLSVNINNLTRFRERAGTRKYGLYTVYYTRAAITVTLSDPISGRTLTSASNQGQQSSRDTYPTYVSTLELALDSALDAALRDFARTL